MGNHSINSKSDKKNLEWDAEFNSFLKEWFSGLIAGIEKLNDETWPKVLELTGRACARVHSGELFWETWEATHNIDDFLVEINKAYGEKVFKKIDDDTISVRYSKCTCPLVEYGLVDSPILCSCSPSWLAENFETNNHLFLEKLPSRIIAHKYLFYLKRDHKHLIQFT